MYTENLTKSIAQIYTSMQNPNLENEQKEVIEVIKEEPAKATHDASPKAAEVEDEQNPNLPSQKDMATNTKKTLDMHRDKVDKKDYPADTNKHGGEKMKQSPKPGSKTLKDIRR